MDLARLDPFMHMDQMGEVDYGPGEPKGTPWHPHRGFETVTYIIDGTFRHQDSNGGGGLITNGDTQWMTAGAGILHIEAPPEELVVSGGLFHGFQLWVNLPARLKMTPPRYQDIRAGQVALLSSADGGALLRVIAGSFGGHAGPGITHTPISLVHATVSAGAQVRLPWRADFNSLGYVLAGQRHRRGREAAGADGAAGGVRGGDAMTFARRAPGDMDILLLGGQPIREPVAAYGPFVMNTRAELDQAFEDFQAGRLGASRGAGRAAPGPRRSLRPVRTIRGVRLGSSPRPGALGLARPAGSSARTSLRARAGQAATARRASRSRAGGTGRGSTMRVAPLVQRDELGQQLGAHAVPGAGDRVHPQGVGHGQVQSSSLVGMPAGSGRNGAVGLVAEHWPRACRLISGANTVRALRTNRTVPSGWLQAPRPVTRPAQRSTSARVCLRCPRTGQLGQPGGDARQPVQARAALAGRLRGQVAGHPGRLGQAAPVGRQRPSTPAPDRRAELPQRSLSRVSAGGLRQRQPGAVVAADQPGLGARGRC